MQGFSNHNDKIREKYVKYLNNIICDENLSRKIEKFKLYEKDGFYLPKNTEHKFLNLSKKKSSLIVCEEKKF